MAASAVRAGAGLELVREILECGTTDEALALLEQGGYLRQTMAVVLEKFSFIWIIVLTNRLPWEQ